MNAQQTLSKRITTAFSYLYVRSSITVRLNDDETIDVRIKDGPDFRAEIDSDDDGYLYFYRADDPEDDTICVRVCYNDLFTAD